MPAGSGEVGSNLTYLTMACQRPHLSVSGRRPQGAPPAVPQLEHSGSLVRRPWFPYYGGLPVNTVVNELVDRTLG